MIFILQTLSKTRLLALMAICALVISACSSSGSQEDIQSTKVVLEGFNGLEAKEVVIRTVVDKKPLATVQLDDQGNADARISVSQGTYAEAIANNKTLALLILEPDAPVRLAWEAASEKVVLHDSASHLLNYLWNSNNAFIQQNSDEIYDLDNTDRVLPMFESLIMRRKARIDANAEQLSPFARVFLANQNLNRAYSYLFYYGKVVAQKAHEDPFFDFIKNIDYNDRFNQYMAKNILLKLEIDYRRTQGLPNSLLDFYRFVGTQIDNQELLSYYRALYIAELTSEIPYWAEHLNLLSTSVLSTMVIAYGIDHPNNPDTIIFDAPAKAYVAARTR